jgi:pimeloyl-ACP methyl ester carboxylesterase
MVRPAAIELTIVALHGNGGGAFHFDGVRPFIPPSICFRPLTLPGFDGAPLFHQLRSLHDYARYLRAMIAAEVRPLVLLGVGSGGAIALEFAQFFGGEVNGLILQGPLLPQAETGRFLPLVSFGIGPTVSKWLIGAGWTRRLFSRRFFRQPPAAEELDRFFSGYRRCTAFGRMFSLITPDWVRTLQPLQLPAALLGDSPTALGFDAVNIRPEHLLPQLLLHPRPDWPYFPMIEQPVDYADEIVALARTLAHLNG